METEKNPEIRPAEGAEPQNANQTGKKKKKHVRYASRKSRSCSWICSWCLQR